MEEHPKPRIMGGEKGVKTLQKHVGPCQSSGYSSFELVGNCYKDQRKKKCVSECVCVGGILGDSHTPPTHLKLGIELGNIS